MDTQPKRKPLSSSSMFEDGRAARPLIEGAIPYGGVLHDVSFETGIKNGSPMTDLPMPLTRALLDRGRQRYDIYCAVCHDRAGTGDGMIVRRGFPRPPSYHIARLLNAPIGHFVDVMDHGFGLMYAYSDRVDAEDRWAIAAYIRALQLSENARLSDAPPAERARLEAQPR